MSTQVQFRRGTTGEHSTFTGALGEVTVNTTLKTCVIHDGSTAGGFSLLRNDGSNSSFQRGSAGDCALQFASDSGTGLFSPGPSQVSLSTGGSARLTIDSTGVATFTGNVSISGDLAVTGSYPDNLALIVALS
tara:strand:+ start:153 stop:551 length:399 start_codon:yes stop_codon:yes gene_type:complete